MLQISDAAHRFLDLEAQEDDVREEEEYEDADHNSFIDDQDYGSDPHSDDDALPRCLSWKDWDEEGNVLLQRILERARASRQRPLPVDWDFSHHAHILPILLFPTEQDYPLWRVHCRLGLEEDAVLFLLQVAEAKHELRAAFSRGSLRGSIFLEATMNTSLRLLLERTPGIVRTRSCVQPQAIEFGDWTKMLTMRDPATSVDIGQWVRVCKGTYTGDVGFITALQNWGGASLLLIPRLPVPLFPGIVPSKRKRSEIRPMPRLFNPETARNTYRVEPIRGNHGDGVYLFNGSMFEHGLIVKTFDLHSLSSTHIFMPSCFFTLFQASGHPRILASSFPRPLEWNFYEHEQVYVVPLDKEGVISAVGTHQVEVDLSPTNEGTRSVSWHDLRKVILVGNFVEVTGGELVGEMGWVESIGSDVVHVLEGVVQNISKSPNLKRFQVHVNWVKVIDPPFVYQSRASATVCHERYDPVPWIGVEIIVNKIGHPMKGYRGVVKDVLCRQPTLSGLKIVVQFTHLSPSCAFKTLLFDYDDIVEITRKLRLYHYRKPTSSNFYPLPVHQELYGTTALAPPASRPMTTSSSGTVELEHLTFSPGGISSHLDTRHEDSALSPAWDPSSRTPTTSRVGCDNQQATESSYHDSQSPKVQRAAEQPLLDPRLVSAKLRVVVNGGKYKEKELLVNIELVDGHPGFRYHHYHTSHHLPAEWITAKHPNPTRDNGLLAIIKGEHCGKYVRRIHHRYENGEVIIKVATIKRSESNSNSLTGEQLELDSGHLCVAFESKEEKQMNDALMRSIREEARKVRAK